METKSNAKQGTSEPDIAAILIRLPREQKARLQRIAMRHHRTLNGELRTVIDQHIAEADGDHDPAPVAA